MDAGDINLAGGVLAGSVALLVSRVNHRYEREREETAAAERMRHEQQLAEDNRQKELFYITTELVFMLERYADGCSQVASDDGFRVAPAQSEAEPYADYPELNLRDVSGDWRVLHWRHMYRIRELPVLQDEAHRAIAYAAQIPAPLRMRTGTAVSVCTSGHQGCHFECPSAPGTGTRQGIAQ